MTSTDDNPTDPSDTDTTGPSLTRMLQTRQAWNGREAFIRAAERARAAGDDEAADRLRDMRDRDRQVAALDALRAQHEMSSLLAGWEWHTVRAAREQGASWAEIAQATRTDPQQARAAYLDTVEQQEQAATRGWIRFDDADDYRAAAGLWHKELHPDTPAHVVEQIEAAVTRDDVDEVAALRSAWWNPAHVPPRTVLDAATDDDPVANAHPDDIDPWAPRPDTGQILHTHTATANRGLGDTEVAREVQEPPWRAQGATVDTSQFRVTDDRAQDENVESAGWPVVPEWMREQARRDEADIAAGTDVPSPPDDLARFAARLDALRAQKAESEAARGEDPRSYAETVGDAATALRAARGSTDDVTTRRDQLTRWSTDDDEVHSDHLGGVDVDVDDGPGRAPAMDDGPGLP